jgi:hypothetical protein
VVKSDGSGSPWKQDSGGVPATPLLRAMQGPRQARGSSRGARGRGCVQEARGSRCAASCMSKAAAPYSERSRGSGRIWRRALPCSGREE